MTNSRVRDLAKSDVRSWSRREVLATGSRLGVVLALPELWIPKAWGQTATFDYYISTSGNDSNPGTLAQPWALTSFQQTSANNIKMAGKRVGIIAGNYSLANMYLSPNWSDNVVQIPGGSASASTYVASCNTSGAYQRGAATLTWTGASLVPGIIGNNTSLNGNNGYITIDGLVINGGPLTGNYPDVGHIMQFYATNYSVTSSSPADLYGIVVQNCEIYGINQTQGGQNLGGIFLAGTVNAVIQNNYLHDINVTSGGNTSAASHCGATTEIGCHGNQYLHNTIANCPASHGVWFKEGSSSGTVAYNYFYNCGTTTFPGSNEYCAAFAGGGDGPPFTGPGQLFVMHHNIVDGCGRERACGNFPQEYTAGEYVYNNTFYSTSTTVGDWGCSLFTDTNGGAAPGAFAQFYNNIYYSVANGGGTGGVQRAGRLNLNPGASRGGTAGGGTNSTGLTNVNNNCYFSKNGNYGTFLGLGNTYYTTLTSWQTAIQAAVAGSESSSIFANPSFSGTITSGKGTSQFNLAGGSPCLGTGQSGVNMGAWDGTVTQIGCSFGPGSTGSTNAVPDAPTLKVS